MGWAAQSEAHADLPYKKKALVFVVPGMPINLVSFRACSRQQPGVILGALWCGCCPCGGQAAIADGWCSIASLLAPSGGWDCCHHATVAVRASLGAANVLFITCLLCRFEGNE